MTRRSKSRTSTGARPWSWGPPAAPRGPDYLAPLTGGDGGRRGRGGRGRRRGRRVGGRRTGRNRGALRGRRAVRGRRARRCRDARGGVTARRVQGEAAGESG